ncbi:unnamed protein product [Moneuplotes crassus]|uniref:Uncharacterized protein n=1 Tax=Euplotes crassus TaxID=5936 RepID=A0AAD1UUD4_EUPCR|nr:unnamed protein product [Moneuplotes crassus]
MDLDSTPEQEEIKALIEGPQVILQRHARSTANASYEELVSKFGDPNDIPYEDLLNNDFNPANRDAKIDQLGIEQCLESQKIANQLPIHTIFVSPLRRALMTAYYVYKDHPDFASIKFILLPQLRESLNIISDIPSNINEVIEEFKELIPQLHIAELNTSLVDQRTSREHWFLNDLEFNIEQQESMSEIKKELEVWLEEEEEKDVCELLCKYGREVHSTVLESRWSVRDRAMEVKKIVKKYLDENEIPEDQKVIIVGHYVIFCHYTQVWEKEYSRDKEIPRPENCLKLKNCQFVSDPNDLSTLKTD